VNTLAAESKETIGHGVALTNVLTLGHEEGMTQFRSAGKPLDRRAHRVGEKWRNGFHLCGSCGKKSDKKVDWASELFCWYVRTKDESYFDDFVRHVQSPLVLMAKEACRGRELAVDEGEDFFQEGLIVLLDHAAEMRCDGNVAGWLATTIRNLIRSKARRRRPILYGDFCRTNDDESSAMKLYEPVSARDEQPEECILWWECEEWLQSAVLRLTWKEREAWKLWWDGIRYGEIAETLEVVTGTVATRIYNAKRSLARMLQEDLPEIEKLARKRGLSEGRCA
jgi:RNA polymerase sigma factor (sigma-70 family)